MEGQLVIKDEFTQGHPGLSTTHMNKNYNTFYTKVRIGEQPARIAQLLQCLRIVWDGDLIAKPERNELVKSGLVYQFDGWNIITAKGLQYLQELGFIHP